jgi:hypothetical protein
VADYLPKFKPGQATTRVATGTIIGGLMVTVAGAVAAADSTTWMGVASKDAITGQTFGVYSEGVQYPTAAGAISAGAPLKCAANGQVTTWVDGTDAYSRYIGIALEAASGAGVQFAAKFVR